MPNVIARIMISADDHLSTKNYGGHRDYQAESLYYFQLKTDLLEQYKCTHMIGLGDLTYGRFTDLGFRKTVNRLLERQNQQTNGRRWEIKGNHDSSTGGMTEYEYYIEEGLLKPSENIQVGQLNISMVDSGALKPLSKPNGKIKQAIIPPDPTKINMVLAHDYIMAKDVNVPPMGDYYSLETIHEWFGIDYLLCGHIHLPIVFSGNIYNLEQTETHQVLVQYPGCLPRPSYMRERTPTTCQVVFLTLYDDGQMQYDSLDIPLWPIEQSFNLEKMAKEEEKAELKKVDVSDIVAKLAAHENPVGNPEDIIMAMQDIPLEYREKAISLIKEA